MLASVARPRLIRSEEGGRPARSADRAPRRGRRREMLAPWRPCRPCRSRAGRQARLAAGCLVLALSAAGLAGFTRYVHDYLLYRGFGPPVATVPPAAQGRIATLAFRSRSLGGRLEHVLVYLPAAYRSQPERRFPVAYLLHGTPGDPRTAFVNSLHVGPRLDLLILRRRVRPTDRRDAARLALDLRPRDRVGRRPRPRCPLVHVSHARPRACGRQPPAHASAAPRAGASAATPPAPMRRSTRSCSARTSTPWPRAGAGTTGRRLRRSVAKPPLVRRFSALDSAPLRAR